MSAGSVELTHEALLREWPRLAGWIEEDRAGLRISRNLTSAAEEWRDLDHDEDALYRGTRLIEADEWRASHEPSLNQLEREFLDASDECREREQRARRKRVRLGFIALAAALGVISVVADHRAVPGTRGRAPARHRGVPPAGCQRQPAFLRPTRA